jgi:hypothetical protein
VNGPDKHLRGHQNSAEDRVFASPKAVPKDPPDNAIRMRLLQHLQYSDIRDREERISRALIDTFEWIYLQRETDDVKWTCFVEWLQSDNGLYWIMGKAGSGKSTIMKFLHSDPRTESHLQEWAQNSKLVIAGHFFWNSGNSMQMSLDGLIRTLLYEIAQSEVILTPDLFPDRWGEIRSKWISEFTFEELEPWTITELLRTFRRLLFHPFDKFRFFFFVDGLDEFSGDLMELIELLKEMTGSLHIKIYVASRTWSVFQDAFNSGPNLTLQYLTYQDISLFVHAEFYKNRGFLELERGDSESATELITNITEKASGVFLWVRIAVQSLLRGLANGDRMRDLIHRLEGLPDDLELLFRKILDSVDPAYKIHSSQLFQIHRAGFGVNANGIDLLLFSYVDDEDQALWEEEDTPLSKDEFLYRVKSIERRLDSRTKGLLEAPTTILKEIEDR